MMMMMISQTLDEVMEIACMVQGVWVLRSTIACTNERDVRARDTLLLHFRKERTITTKQVQQRVQQGVEQRVEYV
jgi:hypothetical protein